VRERESLGRAGCLGHAGHGPAFGS
jgi:hypothetical protein